MRVPGHLTCLLRNLYLGQEATVRTRHGINDWFNIGKGVCQGCVLSLCLYAGLDELQAEIKISGKYQWPQICRWYHSNGRKQKGTKEHLDEDERGEWKIWLITQHSKHYYHGIQSHHFMANRRERVETVTDLLFLGSKITVNGDCSHEVQRHLLLRRKLWQNCGFSSNHVWMWELDHKEGWVLKNWCFWTVMLEKTFESPLGSKEVKDQWILREISPEYSLELLMLKLQYLMQSNDRLEKTWCWDRLKSKQKGMAEDEMVR